ncbi:MAG: metallophosphoesterase-domain-containing protein [Alphaproteobacteria bacterium]|nr:metallophosphoesterase-domain-containing protein [Alphaproteobacteria bacterium]
MTAASNHLTIAVVTDIHHGKDAKSKKGKKALRLIAAFAAFVADAKPDLVLDLGDRISDEDPVTDLRLEQEVNEAFAPIRAVAPVFHICGNHDRDFLSVAQNEAIFGQSLANETIDVGGWRIVLWRADNLVRRGGFQCPDSDLGWLAETVAAADRPLLIASHVPVSGHSQIGNYYFERNPGASTYAEAERIRAVLRQAQVPTLWIAGHVHWNTLTTIDGITHLTQQSLTESFTMSPETGVGEACGAYGMIELSAETIDWQVYGADAFRAILPVKQLARRWYPPLPEFASLPGHAERLARIAAFQAQADE